MFERFTGRLRQVMMIANEVALLLNHDHVGEGHLLLALLLEGEGLFVKLLKSRGVTMDDTRKEVERLEASPRSNTTSGVLPVSPSARHALGLAIEESKQLDHNYVGTEHLILGLIRDPAGITARMLTRQRQPPSEVLEDILSIIGPPKGSDPGIVEAMPMTS
jgi:ATP-dependent Clp protease ATP-binding subunit ClpC